MMYLKECPKCQGDLYLGKDIHGQYVSCIQCGYLRDLPVEVAQAPARKTFAPDTFAIKASKAVKKSRRKVAQAA